MGTRQAILPELHSMQRVIAADTHRYRVVATGRQVGKSILLAEELLVEMVNYGHACWLVAPDYRRTSYVLNYLATFTKNFPSVSFRQKDLRFTCSNGGYIQLVSADDPMALKGDTLNFIGVDEAAFMKPEAWYESLMPMLTVRRGRAIFCSTFYGRNWFYDLWQYADSGKDPEWKAFKFPTTASPFQSAEEIEKIKARTPLSVFMQEYMAEPMADNAMVFRGVELIAVLGKGEPVRHHQYVAGLDWGSNQDYTSISIMDTSTSPICMVALERFNQVGFNVQSNWLADIITYWKPSLIIAEENAAGAPNIAALKAEGIKNILPFQMQTNSKRTLIESWRLAIEQKEVLLLNDEILIGEHLSYEAEQLPSGGYRYGAPRGRHDDTVISSALAWFAASGEYYGNNKIRRVSTSGLYDKNKQRKYPTWGGKPNIQFPR